MDYVLPAHRTEILPASILTAFARHTRRIMAGEVEPTYQETFAGNGWHYPADGFGLLIREQVEPRR